MKSWIFLFINLLLIINFTYASDTKIDPNSNSFNLSIKFKHKFLSFSKDENWTLRELIYTKSPNSNRIILNKAQDYDETLENEVNSILYGHRISNTDGMVSSLKPSKKDVSIDLIQDINSILEKSIKEKKIARYWIDIDMDGIKTASGSLCDLILSDFQEMLIIHLDLDNSIIDIDLLSSHEEYSCIHAHSKLKKILESSEKISINTLVRVNKPIEASKPMIDIEELKKQYNYQKSKQEQPKEQATNDIFSLLKKYWYIALPLGILLILPSDEPQGTSTTQSGTTVKKSE